MEEACPEAEMKIKGEAATEVLDSQSLAGAVSYYPVYTTQSMLKNAINTTPKQIRCQGSRFYTLLISQTTFEWPTPSA